MAKTISTLFVRGDSVAYLAAKGRRVTRWIELPLEPGLVKDGLITDPKVVGSRIHGMLRAEGIRPGKTFVAVTGLHCLTQTIVLPHVQKNLLEEAVRREAEISLPVPLDQLYLSWQIVASTSEAFNIYLAASPRNTADALLETLRAAGIKPYMLDLAPLALSRMAIGITGVMADLRPTEVDIIVMVDGLPQLVRSQTYPAEASSLQEKLLWVKEELERSIDFYDSAHQDKPLDAVAFSGRLPVHVSGKLVQDLAACQFLAGELNRSVLPFQPTLKAPHNFPATQFMVNIGLATKAFGEDGEDFQGINLNLLSKEQRPKGFSYQRVGLTVGSVAAAAALTVFSVMQVQSARAATSSLRSQVEQANKDFERKFSAQQAQKLKLAELSKSLAAAKTGYSSLRANVDALNAITTDIDSSKQRLNEELTLLTKEAEGHVSLENLSLEGENVVVKGNSPDEASALDYARRLRQSGKFAVVVISNLQVTDPIVSFTVGLQARGKD